MADTTELQRLLVSLVGDGSKYESMVQQAQVSTQEAAKSIAQNGKQIEQVANSVNSYGESTKSFVASVAGALEAVGVEEVLRSSFEAFGKRENTLIDLTAAVKMNGEAVETAIPKYQSWASAVSSSTTVSRNQALELVAHAESYGLVGDRAERAAKHALAFANVPGARGSAEAMMRLSAALEQGNVKQAMHMGRLIPALRGVHDQTEFLAKAQKLLAVGTETLNEKSNTAEGVLKRLSNAWQELRADLGQTVSEAVKPMAEWSLKLANYLRNLSPETKKLVVQVMAAGAAFLAVSPALRIASVALAPLAALLKLIVVDLVLGTAQVTFNAAAWVTWQAAVLIATAVSTAFQAAIWLVNAALTGTNTLLAASLLIALPVVVSGLILGFIALSAGIYAIYDSSRELLRTLRAIPSTFGLVREITALFGEWKGIILDIVETFKRGDFENGVKMLVGAFRLAVVQIKDLWPPTWAFIQTGWEKLIDAISMYFKASFKKAVADIREYMVSHSPFPDWMFTKAEKERAARNIEGLRKEAEAEMKDARRALKNGADDAVKAFERVRGAQLAAKISSGILFGSADAVGKVRAQLEEIRKAAKNAAGAAADAIKAAVGGAGAAVKDKLPDPVADLAKRVHDSRSKLEGELWGSVKSNKMIQDYLDNLHEQTGRRGMSRDEKLLAHKKHQLTTLEKLMRAAMQNPAVDVHGNFSSILPGGNFNIDQPVFGPAPPPQPGRNVFTPVDRGGAPSEAKNKLAEAVTELKGIRADAKDREARKSDVNIAVTEWF